MNIPFFLPRGIRNNNPGNIRLSPAKWRGQKAEQHDTAFVEFESPLMGLRALMILLLTYHRKHGLDTVESIINRYAPPHENATDHYTHSVAKALGVRRREKIELGDENTLAGLARAIVRHENGAGAGEWYPAETYQQAARLALHKE
ncbi:MAG TPA: structural protein P5 [Patescibacteria group bacterium]|nr:structural protein P5 [Patescibacteria group bacterium]